MTLNNGKAVNTQLKRQEIQNHRKYRFLVAIEGYCIK